MRAANVDEVLFYPTNGKIISKLKLKIKKNAVDALNLYRYINTVSKTLEKTIIKDINLRLEKTNMYNIPSLAGVEFTYNEVVRSDMRNALNISQNDIVMVISTGGGSRWQKNLEIIESFSDDRVRILNLSPMNIDGDNVVNIFVEYSEVYKYLMAADVAILWRDNNVVNHVASPVKFSEYVCAGLPVVINKNVVLAKEFLCSNNSGLILNDLKCLNYENIKNIISLSNRSISSKQGVAAFGLENIANSYIDVYIEMLNNNE